MKVKLIYNLIFKDTLLKCELNLQSF